MKKWNVKNFLVTIGDEQHTGWLPANAPTPLPNPVRTLPFDFEIEEIENGGGFLLLYESQNGELYGDTWHESEEDASKEAKELFGIPSEFWEEIQE